MSNPSWITPEVIANSKRIHELGGRFKVEAGDCIFSKEGGVSIFLFPREGSDILYPIWSARKCERLLIEKGWVMALEILQDEPRYYFGLRRTGSVFDDYKHTFSSELRDIVFQEALIKVLQEG